MTGCRVAAAGCRDACVPHVRGVVCVVALVNARLRRHAGRDFTTPRVLHEHRHSDTGPFPAIPLSMLVTPLALGR